MIQALLNFTKKKLKEIFPRKLLIRQLDRGSSRCVLLTFDDGPHPEITPKVLNLLKKFGVRAIFFVVGQRAIRAPYLLRYIQEQGHVIGNHTFIHSNSRQPWFLPYFYDLRRCQALIEKHTAKRPTLFRPVGGRISPTSLLVPLMLGMRAVNWSLETNDWRCRTINEAQKTAKKLIGELKSGDIVLMHDDNPHILEILDIVLPFMKSKRFNLYDAIDFI